MTTTPTASPELPDLDKLEALARAATPGPWAYQEDSDVYTHIVRPVQSPGNIVRHYAQDTSGVVEANARFTAGANPAAVLALIALARRAQPEGEAPQAKDTPESMAQSNARFAIDGAIQYGRENRNEPPGTDHWLYEYWNIGRQLAQLGATGWDNVTPAPAASLSPLCGAKHAESGKEVAVFANDGAEPSWSTYAADEAAQKAAAPSALTRDALAQMLAGKHVNDYGYRMLLNGEEIGFNLDHLLDIVKTAAPSAPGTPEAPSDKHLPYWERGIATVTLNGHQLREALDFINPDGEGDPDQLDDDLTFGIVQHEDDEGKAKSSMCCWNDDTDGVLPLDSEPRAAQLDSGQEGSESNG